MGNLVTKWGYLKGGLLGVALLQLGACGGGQPATQKVAKNDQALGDLAKVAAETKDQKTKNRLEAKLREKRFSNTLALANTEIISNAFKGHTELYSLKGNYRVMVIPVQFADEKFTDEDFFRPGADGKVPAADYLFGDGPNSLSSYYRHASLGKFQVDGEITPVVTVDGTLKDYGEAVPGNSDKNARGLVVQALSKLKEKVTDEAWWESFDRWDLGDYDADGNHYEPDGFLDAVVLVYAGKAQSSCQRDFDPDGKRLPSDEVPEGPKKAATVECFNRIWPHRWMISLGADDPQYVEKGPVVEGLQRPSMNGLKITDHVFALDYNMQSEYSDRATFIHEFGHSLSLPDIYANDGDNSTGSWEVMSSTSNDQAQEMSSYSKVSLGWISPKMVRQGQTTTAYLGNYNFVSNTQRENFWRYRGPKTVDERVNGQTHTYDVVSTTPDFGEAVYRSIMVLTNPTQEKEKVAETPEFVGHVAAYSGKFDGQSRSLLVKLPIPETGDATLSFDLLHHIETETNFDSKDEEIKVITDFDLGTILINGKAQEELRTISGDANADTLAEANGDCQVQRVLDLRKKAITTGLTDPEKEEFKAARDICQKPVWVKKSYDLSDLRAQGAKEAELEIRYVTDPGYTELGILVDNIQLGSTRLDFEGAKPQLGDFEALVDGQVDKTYQQAYFFEYRNPGESFKQGETELSYNMDNHIRAGEQSYFLEGQESLRNRFRLVELEYEPGVVVWYFNSRFNRRENNPEKQDGKGYLLVLNSRKGELKLPGLLGRSDLFGEDGAYDEKSEAYKAFETIQRQQFTCFAYTAYATYIDGEAPQCDAWEGKDDLLNLTQNGKPLMYRRERFNELLPWHRVEKVGVGKPLRTAPEIRTALSAFRPKDAGEVAPFSIYRAQGDAMVLDEKATASAERFAPVDRFSDKDSALPENSRFWGDSVVVEKKGFGFRVLSPSQRILSSYVKEGNGDANDHYFRRPRVKMVFTWE